MAKTEQLIELVRNHRILYDLSHEDYRNIRKKDKIWDQIGAELSETGDEAKKRWKNLRDSFAKYVRSTKSKTGQAANNNKKWLWADQMRDFRPFLSFAKTSSNVSGVACMGNAPDEVFAELNAELGDSSEEVEEPSNIAETNESYTQFTDEVQPPSSSPVPGPSKERQRKRKAEAPSSVGNVISYLENKKKNAPDATDCLFMAYAKTLKTFSSRRQVMTKMRIAQIMMEEELSNLEESSSSAHSYSPPSNENVVVDQNTTHTDNLHPGLHQTAGAETDQTLTVTISQSEYDALTGRVSQKAATYFASFNPCD